MNKYFLQLLKSGFEILHRLVQNRIIEVQLSYWSQGEVLFGMVYRVTVEMVETTMPGTMEYVWEMCYRKMLKDSPIPLPAIIRGNYPYNSL